MGLMCSTCKHYQSCPVYWGKLRNSSMTTGVYRQLYCDAGVAGWMKCRRYQVKEKTGSCPDRIIPNAPHTVEEIIRRFGLVESMG